MVNRNKYDLSGDYGIGWTAKGEEFWFDKEDYDLIKNYSWHYSSNGYVVSTEKKTKNKIALHRLVMGNIPEKMVVDHLVHPKGREHKIDNRKSNLEIKTQSQNNMNANTYCTSSSGVRGVTYDSKINKWQARICINYKRIHLGWFDNINDAIIAREEAEKKYYGKYGFKEINKEVN